jgi:toxin-antitoxin system PIN domain toxin
LILADVNVLLHAWRADSDLHAVYRPWLTAIVNGAEPFGVSLQALSGMVRIATNPKAYQRPDKIGDALEFANALLAQPHCRVISPGSRHWAIFCDLCRNANASGNLVQDAWFAALAIEHGCEWITEDRDYARFPGLRWRSVARRAV